MSMDPKDRIILPLDVADIGEAANLVKTLSPYVGVFTKLAWSLSGLHLPICFFCP